MMPFLNVVFFVTLLVGSSCAFSDIDAFRLAQPYKEAANRALIVCAAGAECVSDQITSHVFKAITSLPLHTVDSLFSTYLGNQPVSLTTRMVKTVSLRRLQQKYGDEIADFDQVLELGFNTNVTNFFNKLMSSTGSFEDVAGSILSQLRVNLGIEDAQAEEFWKSINTFRGYEGEDVKQALTFYTNKTIYSLSSLEDRVDYCDGLLDNVDPNAEGSGFESLKNLFQSVCTGVRQPEARGLIITPKATVAAGYTTSQSKCGSIRTLRVSNQLKTTLTSLRVFGGNMAAKAEYKFLVTLVYKGYVICTGTVIDATHVMTAAHCTANVRAPDLKVNVAEYDTAKRDGEVSIRVKRIRNHPRYNSRTIQNDIAILTLSRSVSGIKNVEAVCLPYAVHCTKMNMRKCFVAGWGATKRVNGRLVYPRNPYEGSVLAYHGFYCPKRNPAPTNKRTQMCAIGKADTCSGDSGGPLFCQWGRKWTQCGITSYGPANCNARGTNGVYTHVVRYRDWIKSALKT